MTVSVEGVSVRLGEREVLLDVSAEFSAGEVAAIVGANGSGKSTLLDVIAGLRRPDVGRVGVSGQIGFVRQQPAIDRLLTVRENLGFFVDVHGADRSRIGPLLDRSGLADRSNDRAGTLSGGMLRRLDLLRALSVGPRVLLLDEPTSGLDTASRSAFVTVVRELTTRDEITTLWVTHTSEETDAADRVFMMNGGRLTELYPHQRESLWEITRGGEPPIRVPRAEAQAVVASAIETGHGVECRPVLIAGQRGAAR